MALYIAKHSLGMVQEMSNHKYVIRVDDKIIWEGLDLQSRIKEILRKYSKKKISVEWVPTKEDILIV